jgi:hypothetical protein
MSISAEISRKVVFSSIEEFWKYLKSREEVKTKCLEFSTFYDTVFLAKFGCPCNTDELNEEATEMYRYFDQIKTEVWDFIKSNIGCDNIIFNLDDEFLFEI